MLFKYAFDDGDCYLAVSYRYERNDIAELIARFEEPLATNRWDSPLFTIKIGIHDGASSVGDISSERSMRLFGPKEVQLPLVDVYSSLVEVRLFGNIFYRIAGLSTQLLKSSI